jgi:hypothetical protein
MRYFLFLCLALLGITTILTSCEKEAVFTDAENPAKSHPGHLLFSDDASFLAAMETSISEANHTNVHPNSKSAFISYSEVYNDTEERLAAADLAGTLPSSLKAISKEYDVLLVADEEGGYDTEPIVRMPRLRSMLNENKLLQIGNKIMQYEESHVVISEYDKTTDFVNLRNNPEITIEDRETISSSSFDKGSKDLRGLCNAEYSQGGKDHRLKARWYGQTGSFGGVSIRELWIDLEHQKKGAFGIWYDNSENSIGANGTVIHYAGSGVPTRTTNVARTAFRRSDFNIDIFAAGTSPGDPSDWYMTGSSVLHQCEDGGPIRSCTIAR